MITEDYCSFEIAKLLKAKGFDEKTLSYYEDNVLCHGDWFEWNRSPLGHIAAPTHQMAMKWLREIHKLFIMILLLEKEEGNYGYTVEKIGSREFISTSGNISYDTTEDAVEAALKYTLENLIQLWKEWY